MSQEKTDLQTYFDGLFLSNGALLRSQMPDSWDRRKTEKLASFLEYLLPGSVVFPEIRGGVWSIVVTTKPAETAALEQRGPYDG